MRVENENQWEPFNGASWPIKGLNIKCNNSLQFGYFRHDHIRKSCIIWVYYGLWTLSGENKVTNRYKLLVLCLSLNFHSPRYKSVVNYSSSGNITNIRLQTLNVTGGWVDSGQSSCSHWSDVDMKDQEVARDQRDGASLLLLLTFSEGLACLNIMQRN